MFRRERADPQPTEHVAVLLASSGGAFRTESIELAAELANRGPVGIVIIAKVYGSSFGLPNPGLMPTKRERQDAFDRVDAAIKQLRKLGIRADGQVLITRNIASGIAKVAKARTANHVVIETPSQGAVRGFLEGNYESAIRRKLRDTANVESVPFT